MSFESINIRKTKNGYILSAETRELVEEEGEKYPKYDSSEYVFTKPSGVKKAVAILLKEEDK